MRSLTTALVTVFALTSVACNRMGSGGTAPSPIAPPPTLVLAWTAPGGLITTLESSDGFAWSRRTVHDTTNRAQYGPALAHDGTLAWILMWANGPELQYKVGFGGTSAAAGISWESQPTSGVLPVFPASSPALAWANGRWLAVWRDANDTLRAVRSAAGSAASWDTVVTVVHGGAQPSVAIATRAPALTSATVNGQRRFVLAYRGNPNAMVATSADGITWTPAVATAATQKDPALAESNGSLYLLLSRQVGIGYTNFLYRSNDAVAWREIASHLQAPQNAAGPGLAITPWKLFLTEQIGGAIGGSFNGISNRTASPGSPSSNPTGYVFAGDRRVTFGGTTERVGNTLARTALLYAEPGTQPIRLTDVAITQSGVIDSLPLRGLVAGKTTLVRASLRARGSGAPGQVDSARIDVIDAGTGQMLASEPGFAFASDNVTLLTTIPDSADAHFFLPGASIANNATVRFDLTLFAGNTRRAIAGVLDNVPFERNEGLPLVLTGFDQNSPSAATVAAELMQLARIYPVADGVQPLGTPAGVRFRYDTGIPLPVQGGTGSFVDEFVLVNVALGVQGPSGQICAPDVIRVPVPGRNFVTNFTVPEDLDGDGVFSAAELANCMGNPTPLTIRYNNYIARLKSETLMRWNAAGSVDPPRLASAVLTAGNINNSLAQNRSPLAGQCPQGLGSDRLCWASVGINAPVLQHELGHAFGHCDVGNANCAANTQTFAAGFAYDVVNRRRISSPLRLMAGSLAFGSGNSFFTPAEYEFVRQALFSQQYLARSLGAGVTRLAALAPVVAAQDEPGSILVEGVSSTPGDVRIRTAHVTSIAIRPSAPGDDIAILQVDSSGRELRRSALALPAAPPHRLESPSSDVTTVPFALAVPLHPRARGFIVERNSRAIHRLTASASAPTVRLDAAPFVRSDSIIVAWTANDRDGDALRFDITLHDAAGDLLTLLATRLSARRLALDGSRVAGGDNLTLRVVASDGFHIAFAERAGISLPDHSPQIALTWPLDNAIFLASGWVPLRAVAVDAEDGMIAGDRVRWTSDVQGELGSGEELLVRLEPGTHVITVTASDRRGAQAESRITITVRSSAQR